MKIISKILESAIFKDSPPVLIDIGASGEINSKWKSIARYCVCLAFDADEREFTITEQTSKDFRKLIKINRIVTATADTNATFYLTKSPFCSSLLEPEKQALSPWIFEKLFEVEKTVTLQTTTVNNALEQAGLHYVDWFKTDTQGTDLRLFTSLPSEIKKGILCVELEPGIIDAYQNEDKLYSVMKDISSAGFWLSNMIVKGVQRIKPEYAEKLGTFTTSRSIKASPGWAEVTYLRLPTIKSERDYLLLFVFSLLEKQYGFALEVLDEALKHYPTPLMEDCRKSVLVQLQKNKLTVPLVILKRQIKKIFSGIHD
ncbi:MAG: hypothetical protein EOP48_06500 [Sphingobacteriales bacterium]|nr:MAG: hypothetical protein EOP48_06500 [Sphingobacteriales bacterium]